MGGPAGVAQAQGAVDGAAALYQVAEHLQPALGLLHLKALFPVIYRDAGGIIPSIFQPGKAVQQDGGGLLPAYESNDTTHVRSSRNSEFEQR